MDIQIRDLSKKDYKQAIQFAVTGMHFDLYFSNRFFLNLYGKYFWYSELNCATQVIAAYAGDKLAGVLLADMNGEKKTHRTFFRTASIKAFEFLAGLFSKDGAGVYDRANTELFEEFTKENQPDGQIAFLAADPKLNGKGIGSMLLKELERREKGRLIYLYTDDACTYQFYERRGFERFGERGVTLTFGGQNVPLTCWLYSKRL